MLTSRSTGPSWRRRSATAAARPAAIGDVGDRGGRDAAARRDQLDGAVELVAGPGDHGDGRAGVGEGRGDELTDAPTGAGDERHRTPESARVETERPCRRLDRTVASSWSMVVDMSCILNGSGRAVLSSDCSSPPGDRHAEQRLLRTARRSPGSIVP